MICLEEQYFSVNKILLLGIGLWPNKQTKYSRFHFIIIFSMLASIIVAQFLVFLTTRCTVDLIIKVFSSLLIFLVIEITYFSIGIDIRIVKEIFAHFQHIFNEISDENEAAIAEKYGHNARRYTLIITMTIMCTLCAVLIGELWLYITPVIFSSNISHFNALPIVAEYFVNQEKYFYFILLHVNATICLTVYTSVAIGTLFITLFHCIYGMFKIARYRIEHSISTNMLINNSIMHEKLCSKRIICAIDIQRKAMKLSAFLTARFEGMLISVITFTVSNLSLHLFRIFQIVLSNNDNVEMMPNISCVIALTLYMFFGNYVGQELTDHSKEVLSAAYNTQWYLAPLRIQKLILFLLLNGSKDFTLTVGRLYVPSFEAFATLVKTSVSYFTVIQSTRW